MYVIVQRRAMLCANVGIVFIRSYPIEFVSSRTLLERWVVRVISLNPRTVFGAPQAQT